MNRCRRHLTAVAYRVRHHRLWRDLALSALAWSFSETRANGQALRLAAQVLQEHENRHRKLYPAWLNQREAEFWWSAMAATKLGNWCGLARAASIFARDASVGD